MKPVAAEARTQFDQKLVRLLGYSRVEAAVSALDSDPSPEVGSKP